jgi:hypothetical protein
MTDNGLITIKLTPIQAKVLWNTVDGASDAGACEGGCTPQEARALNAISDKLIKHHDKWKSVRLDQG